MSTIVVVRKDGVAAIGADTLSSYGSLRKSSDFVRNYSKIITVGDNYLALTGHASFPLILTSYCARHEKKPRLDSVQAIFEFLRGLHAAMKEDYFLRPEEDEDDELESSQFDCLIANPSGIFGMDSLRSVEEYSRYYALGTGYRLALGAMHAVYGTDAPVEEIARAGLAAAAEFDDATGEPLEVFSVALRSE